MLGLGPRPSGVLALASLAFLLPSAAGYSPLQNGKLKYTGSDGKLAEISMALASFGKSLYGGSMQGQLVYPASHSKAQCRTEDGGEEIGCEYGCADFDKAVPPLDSPGNPLHGMGSRDYVGIGGILLLDRGPSDERGCNFVLKAWHAQLAKAQAVVIVNYENRLITMDRAQDDEIEAYIANLTIPAALISKDDGSILKQALLSADGHYSAFSDMQLPVTLSWEDILPKKQVVQWEFWTTSNNACGSSCNNQKAFIKQFADVAKQLHREGVAIFEPHYLPWVCPPQYKDSVQCQSQCINDGRYCSLDPEDDMTGGYDGKDVILENLRQLCVFKMANATGWPWLWWDYATRFGEQCKMSEGNYNEACAEEVFLSLGGRNLKGGEGLADGLQGLKQCIGNPDESVNNSLLDAQIATSETSKTFRIPTVRINGGEYRGTLNKLHVLSALCSTFKLNQEPEICKANAEDKCAYDGEGYTTCAARTDGRTRCINTFSNYYCDCGEGWISREVDGEVQCLDLNECNLLHPADLGEACSCERCACHNEQGGYWCEDNIRNACETNNPCWTGTVDGKDYTACVDLIDEYKELAKDGKVDFVSAASKWHSSIPTYKCECPPCFTDDGYGNCEPVSHFAWCSEGDFVLPETDGSNGMDTNTLGTSRMFIGIIVIISCVVIAIIILASYRVYKLQRHSFEPFEPKTSVSKVLPSQC